MAKHEEISAIIKEKFGGGILEEHPEALDPYLVFDRGIILELAPFLRDEPKLRFDLLSVISTVDYLPVAATPDGKTPAKPGRIEVVYILDSTGHHHRLVAKAYLDREAPRIASVENIWHAADWHEREAFDLMGVVFDEHPNLQRILLDDDWEGHPLRKDYPIGGEPVRFSGDE